MGRALIPGRQTPSTVCGRTILGAPWSLGLRGWGPERQDAQKPLSEASGSLGPDMRSGQTPCTPPRARGRPPGGGPSWPSTPPAGAPGAEGWPAGKEAAMTAAALPPVTEPPSGTPAAPGPQRVAWAAVPCTWPPGIPPREEQGGKLVAHPRPLRAQVQREQGRLAGATAAWNPGPKARQVLFLMPQRVLGLRRSPVKGVSSTRAMPAGSGQ